MKYLVLLAEEQGTWQAATPEQRQVVMDAHTAFHQAVAERATMLAGEALAEAPEGRTLRHVDGQPLVTEGPYAEGVEQLGGFYLVEAESQDVVLDLCHLLPTSYAVEVRPVIEIEGYEDDRDGE
ncbi:YciI family protein [Nocardioides cynanchi]|uniref:YciI family protein n=1 Tax=Nocardioides cynanchi TaxID=2558918 RepID=UPI0012468C2E|nr:YciI family protein [Nocardioides cynanchi]